MVSLTIQQRDILQYLLQADKPVTLAEIGATMHLTSRQVNYRLRDAQAWLNQRGIRLEARTGVGYEIDCTAARRRMLLDELHTGANFNLVFQAGEREQLLAIKLLTSDEPVILKQIQQFMDASRATILKDIDSVEAWLTRFVLHLERRPNYGFLIQGEELLKRQAIAALLWGDTPFANPLVKITYDQGLCFSLAGAASYSPFIKEISALLQTWNVHAAFEWVAQAEAHIGGRFADDAVLHLALALAVQRERVAAGKIHACSAADLAWLQTQPVWTVATHIAHGLWPAAMLPETEIAVIAMHLLASIRNEEWPGEPWTTPAFKEVITLLVENVAQAFLEPELVHDPALREGLAAHVLPALMRQRFNLWSPPVWSDEAVVQECFRERKIAQTLATLIEEHEGVALPAGEIDTITLLLRAAYVRARPARRWRAFVICPSGMATAQLLAARLKTRFPNLEILGVLSQRELASARVAEAQLLITTIPIEAPLAGVRVIEVHPLLLPQDVAAISKWISG